MKTRGRDSAASQSIIAGGFAQRPEPPSDLTARQDQIWREVVASEAPEFFNSAVLRGLLADYCRTRVAGDEISRVIDGLGAVWKDDLDSMHKHDLLLRMRDREMKRLVTIATKLRLTNQSRYLPETAARASAKAPAEDVPWLKSA